MRKPGAAALAAAVLMGCVSVGPQKIPAEKMQKLVAGYPTLYAHMQEYGCPRCHTTGPQQIANIFKLPPPGENDTLAVHMLWDRIDHHNLAASKLVLKPSGEMGHRGGMILMSPQRAEWMRALERWLEG